MMNKQEAAVAHALYLAVKSPDATSRLIAIAAYEQMREDAMTKTIDKLKRKGCTFRRYPQVKLDEPHD